MYKLSALVPVPCVTCGEPVVWMAQHRECWQREKPHGVSHAPRKPYRRRHTTRELAQSVDRLLSEFPSDVLERIETESRDYAAGH